MLLSGTVMFFNTSLVEIFTKLTDYTGSYLWGRCGDGLGELWRGAKVLLRRLASPQILFYCTLYVQLRSSLWQITGDSAA